MEILIGDCLEVMAGMEPDSVDAIVTDPPYGLGFMGKHWDGMPPGPETAAAMLRLLKPAHYLVAFGGTRTHHRLMCALEDAGFEIRDTLMWLYGSGFPKGKGQLKPAWEPIVLCRKPGDKVRELGIYACRIGTNDCLNGGTFGGIFGNGKPTIDKPIGTGRWPANLILDEEAGAMLDEQSGWTAPGGYPAKRSGIGYQSNAQGQDGLEARSTDSGGASRFFYCPKASRSERGEGNNHPTVKPVALMRWLVRLMSPEGGTVLDPFMGSGTTGVACVLERRDFVGIEREPDYIEIARARINASTKQGVFV